MVIIIVITNQNFVINNFLKTTIKYYQKLKGKVFNAKIKIKKITKLKKYPKTMSRKMSKKNKMSSKKLTQLRNSHCRIVYPNNSIHFLMTSQLKDKITSNWGNRQNRKKSKK
jgi:hypothetical protein